MKRKASSAPSQLLIGVSNSAGCVVAVLHWNGCDFDTLARAPAMLADEARIRLAAGEVLDRATRAGSGQCERFDPDQG